MYRHAFACTFTCAGSSGWCPFWRRQRFRSRHADTVPSSRVVWAPSSSQWAWCAQPHNRTMYHVPGISLASAQDVTASAPSSSWTLGVWESPPLGCQSHARRGSDGEPVSGSVSALLGGHRRRVTMLCASLSAVIRDWGIVAPRAGAAGPCYCLRLDI